MDIKARARKVIEVNIEGRGTYTVPLLSSTDPVTVARFAQARKAGETETLVFLVEFFTQHIGDAMEALTMEDFNELVQAWDRGGEPTAGESPASSS